ncbi:hypothetical protein ACODIN_06070 [Vagococcus fluvialis]|nr:hypothetical protein [Vagococcus fluvialis]
MLNLSDKRQHFRFPAYDDEIGVKLVSNRKRDFLKDVLDDGFVYREQESYFPESKKSVNHKTNKTLKIDAIDMVDTPDYFGYEEEEKSESIKMVQKNRTAAFKQKEVTVEKGRRTLENNTYIEPKTSDYTSPQSSFSNKLFEADQYGNAKYHKRDRNRSKFESSYDLPGTKGNGMFKPKHIPASLIEESHENELPRHSRDVIVDELRKASSGSLLMIEDEVILDPIIDSVEITADVAPTLVPEKKKNQRLEKTLSGIIEEEGSTKLDSYYFD